MALFGVGVGVGATLSMANLLLLLLPACVDAKAVFAHFMMSNTKNYTLTTWKTDIQAAQESSIDAFVLNLGFEWLNHTSTNPSPYPVQLTDAFAAAEQLDFHLLFSFDFSATNSRGTWSNDAIVDLITEFTPRQAYFRHDGRPVVSTFEGFLVANSWTGIKQEIKAHGGADVGEILLIPDWTSVGATRAAESEVTDGLMCWNAWPDGTHPMNTTEDELYIDLLGDDKLYIMPVSPWFYTNLAQFEKNWVWRGGDLWYERWQQVLEVNPDFVEIITWNDYGESHYIGPLHEEAVVGEGLKAAGAPFDYVAGRPHDGWRILLPYLIEQYKVDGGSEEERVRQREEVEIAEELLSVWYRLSPARACTSGNTTGNTESHNQVVLQPGELLQDKVFYSALLEGSTDVSVSIGGANTTEGWSDVPATGRGIYHGSADIGDREGEVEVTISRDGQVLLQLKGKNIELQMECPLNQTNWNAWVGNATAVEGGPGVESDAENGAAGTLYIRSWTAWMVMAGIIMELAVLL
ncbi:glycoside hydrolase [Aspergillus karnatakaensis]|uniref:glycoside hydrolase family 71 protein n=1 Tax=Aspergillus karnatakaensis TaxID=1810916 RepID=UPI003CCCB70E